MARRGKSKKRGRRRQGHYCWCCDRYRANERFSGRGHGRHLCRDCQKLGKEELACRQHERNIDRLLGFDGLIHKKRRAELERYLKHPNPRVRRYAEEVKQHDEELRRQWREAREADRLEEEAHLAELLEEDPEGWGDEGWWDPKEDAGAGADAAAGAEAAAGAHAVEEDDEAIPF